MHPHPQSLKNDEPFHPYHKTYRCFLFFHTYRERLRPIDVYRFFTLERALKPIYVYAFLNSQRGCHDE
ncbi:hypothetical protein ES703_64281 [subsurface metagenome]